MEMTKEDARELILEWANDKLEFDVEKGEENDWQRIYESS